MARVLNRPTTIRRLSLSRRTNHPAHSQPALPLDFVTDVWPWGRRFRILVDDFTREALAPFVDISIGRLFQCLVSVHVPGFGCYTCLADD